MTLNLFMKKQQINFVSFLSQIVDKVKAALDTAVGILNDKDGWKVNLYLSVSVYSSDHAKLCTLKHVS